MKKKSGPVPTLASAFIEDMVSSDPESDFFQQEDVKSEPSTGRTYAIVGTWEILLPLPPYFVPLIIFLTVALVPGVPLVLL